MGGTNVGTLHKVRCHNQLGVHKECDFKQLHDESFVILCRCEGEGHRTDIVCVFRFPTSEESGELQITQALERFASGADAALTVRDSSLSVIEWTMNSGMQGRAKGKFLQW